jgi:hypothetical protein
MENKRSITGGGISNNKPRFLFLAFTILLLVFYSSILFSATIYIDPTFTGSTRNGSITNPYSSWTSFTLVSGNTYLQKKGTTYTSSTQISIDAKSNITLGSYGTGNRPVFSYTGSGYAFRVQNSSNCTIQDFEVNGNVNAHSLVAVIGSSSNYTSNITINNCVLHNAHNTNNAGFGIYGFYNNNLSILNTVIHNVAIDGIYLANIPGVEIGQSHIYNINRRFFVNSNQTYSSGDGIQLDGNYNGFHIHHTIIDRTNGAGNKFNLILNSAPGTSDNASGIIEYCTFINGSNVAAAVHIERGNGIITRYNTFQGNTLGLRIAGAYTTNNLIHNNIFYNCTSGVGVGYTYPSVGPATNTKVYNNVFYRVSNYHIWVDKTNVDSRNNIHLRGTDNGVAIYNYGGGSWTIRNNCYGTSATAGTPGTGSNPVIGNPLFVNLSNYDFHLQSNSPCINKGVNVGISYDIDGTSIFQGSAPDIGAYEYISSSGSNLPPVINNQSFSVNENSINGTNVGTVVATDPNAGQTLTYTIVSGNTNNAFSLNSSTGQIIVANSAALNYEVTSSYALVVRVTDNGAGNLWSQATITINILNINEPPVISNQAFSVAQNLPNGTLVGTVQASDPDQGQILTFSITGGNTNSCFAINASTGAITVANSGALTPQTFNLTVRATDNGSPILYTQATVSITVTSVNQAPVINNQSFSTAQGTPNGTVIGTVIASDPNQGQSLSYSITGGNTSSCFAINASNGVLTVNNSAALAVQIYNLTIRVTDNGVPSLSSQATVSVNVIPANQTPVIENQTFYVEQYAPAGTVVGMLIATDPDPGQILTYSLTTGNSNGIFAINPATGAITVVHSFALYPRTFYMMARATDNGTPALFAEAMIQIIVPETNYPPVINNQTFTTRTYPPAGSVIGTVVASDPNQNQQLTYTITAGNSNGIFALNPNTGALTVVNPSALYVRTLYLMVRATDNGYPSMYAEAIISIVVTNASGTTSVPVAKQYFNTSIFHPEGSPIGRISPLHSSKEINVTYIPMEDYTLEGFSLNSSNGEITIANTNILSPGKFECKIGVLDNEELELMEVVDITISVTEKITTTETKEENNMQNISIDSEFVVYPNPSVDGIFHIGFSGQPISATEIAVFDLSGSLIFNTIFKQSDKITIDLSGQPKGTYLLKVFNGLQQKSIKAIIG